MKKIILLNLVLLGFVASTNSFAVAYDAKIAGCTNKTQLVSFRVDASGWYYLSIPFGTNNVSGWYLLTTWQTFQVSATGGNRNSFFNVTDLKTQTPVTGKCL